MDKCKLKPPTKLQKGSKEGKDQLHVWAIQNAVSQLFPKPIFQAWDLEGHKADVWREVRASSIWNVDE